MLKLVAVLSFLMLGWTSAAQSEGAREVASDFQALCIRSMENPKHAQAIADRLGFVKLAEGTLPELDASVFHKNTRAAWLKQTRSPVITYVATTGHGEIEAQSVDYCRFLIFDLDLGELATAMVAVLGTEPLIDVVNSGYRLLAWQPLMSGKRADLSMTCIKSVNGCGGVNVTLGIFKN